MRWTVVCQPLAETRLTELWPDGPDRAAITQSANQIDFWLQTDPLRHGEARADDVRILVESALAVYYTVSQLDCLVSVFAVWRSETPP
jgi:hypothetical protein